MTTKERAAAGRQAALVTAKYTLNDIPIGDLKQNTTAESCDRYQNCSANICPLEGDWQKRLVSWNSDAFGRFIKTSLAGHLQCTSYS